MLLFIINISSLKQLTNKNIWADVGNIICHLSLYPRQPLLYSLKWDKILPPLNKHPNKVTALMHLYSTVPGNQQ
jgi:hypothetical protein